ncbi:MAG TPA: YccF domain-containing protein [Thauera sp.]|nr:YccF domain-containing protein [Thauera sp.]HRA79873.1 YccF domain-containing protein [Thauera sp.]
MNNPVPAPLPFGQPSENMVTVTHLIYALHAFAVFTGLVGSATIIGSFVASLPSIAAIVLNYWNQTAVRGTWLESHFRWQIRTFWFAVLWIVVAVVMLLTVIGIPFALLVMGLAGLWVLYRVVRGWLALIGRRSMPLD